MISFVCALLDLCRFCCGHLLLNMSFQCLELQSCLCLKHVYENSGYSFFPNNTVYYTDILDQCNAVVAAVRQECALLFESLCTSILSTIISATLLKPLH